MFSQNGESLPWTVRVRQPLLRCLPAKRFRRAVPAPVAQGIEHAPPERGAQVRILPGAQRSVFESVARTWCRGTLSRPLRVLVSIDAATLGPVCRSPTRDRTGR